LIYQKQTKMEKLNRYSIKQSEIAKYNLTIDKIKTVDGVDFELSKTGINPPNNAYTVWYYIYEYTAKSSFATKEYRGYKYTHFFRIKLDGSKYGEYYKINDAEKEFKTERDVVLSIDKLYSLIDDKYKNASNMIDSTTIGKSYLKRTGRSMIYRFEGKEDSFDRLMDSLLINRVTSIKEYKEIMLETIYYLIKNEAKSNKGFWMYQLTKKYRDIYS